MSRSPHETKRCKACRAEKGWYEFAKDRRCRDGLSKYCDACQGVSEKLQLTRAHDRQLVNRFVMRSERQAA